MLYILIKYSVVRWQDFSPIEFCTIRQSAAAQLQQQLAFLHVRERGGERYVILTILLTVKNAAVKIDQPI